ncbi:MAG: hypothetical protein IPL61_24630 [Myxococcales bacterium]|nr:hypothetical protein [Myxococcales bacterium]
MHRLTILLAAALAVTAACTDPADAPPTEGTWLITRTVPTQPAGCFTLAPNTIEVQVTPGDAAPVALTATSGSTLRPQELSATEAAVVFVTEDYALSEPGRPILIKHQLHVDGAQLLGTGTAQGDAEDLGCTYSLDLVGTRM